jgi:hypothetical protein
MKKRIIISITFIVLGLFLIVAIGNANAFNQTIVNLPITMHNFCPFFSDDFSNPSSGWYIGEDNFAKWEYVDGEYRILSKDDSFYYWTDAPTCARENYSIEVDARWEGASGISYGIQLGSNLEFDRLYSFEVSSDYQKFSLYYWDGYDWYPIVPPTVSPFINVGMASNNLKVTRNGVQITLEVNGNVLGTWSDGNITGPTYTGIMSDPYVGSPTSDARFDNFSVTQVNIEKQNSGIQNNSLVPVLSPRTFKYIVHWQD